MPKTVEPSLKATVPVAGPPELGVTVAVNVMPVPAVAEVDETSSFVVVATLPARMSTVTAAEVLLAKLASPPYTAVMECEPAARVETFSVVQPAPRVAVPKIVELSLKVTVPVGPEPGLTVAVNVMVVPGAAEVVEACSSIVVLTLPVMS